MFFMVISLYNLYIIQNVMLVHNTVAQYIDLNKVQMHDNVRQA